MNIDNYHTIGPDRPLGDWEGTQEDWSPKRVQEISNEEVKNPEDQPEQELKREIEESERKD